jgi:hypothetical protein
MTRCQKVHVYKTNAASHDGVPLKKDKNFIVIGFRGKRQGMQQGNNLLPVLEIATCKLPDNKRVEKHFLLLKQIGEAATFLSEVINPYRGVDKDHYTALRRGTRFAPGSLPQRAAKRRALWREMSASSPIRTKVVFSRTPVSRDASARIVSSILSVVFIHIRMGKIDVYVKQTIGAWSK